MTRQDFEIRRILIIRPSSIGDIVMASPMLRALKQEYPEARISWLSDPSFMALLRFNPFLDEVIPWDKNRWKMLWKKGHLITLIRELNGFSQKMRNRRFDLTLDAQGLLRSRLLARLSHAPVRIGFTSKEPGTSLMTRIISRGPSNKQMCSEYEHMVRELGISPFTFSPELVLSDDDLTAGREIVKDAGILGKYAVLCPFTTRPQKHWVSERWATLAAAIHETFGLPCVLLGGAHDRSQASRIHEKANHHITNLTGRTDLSVSSAIIKRCALAIGVDTGLTHIAIAFDRPTVALFGATCPYLSTCNQHTVVLYQKIPCSPCKRRPTCDGEYPCMKKIRPQDVLEAAKHVTNNG